MQLLLFTWTLLTSYLCAVAGQQACSTPNGRSGNCIPIQACSTLMYEDNSFCEREDDSQSILVCCPSNACTTPKGVEGTCTALHRCPDLVQMLICSFSQNSVQYVAKSRCPTTEQNGVTVCCATQPRSSSRVIPSTTSRNVPSWAPKVSLSRNLTNEGHKKKEQTNTRRRSKCELNAFPPHPGSKCCGVQVSQDNRIIGGTKTSIDEYPWLAIIEYEVDEVIRLLCGGALISGRYVMTAAHCLKPPLLSIANPVNVRLGEYNTTYFGRDCAMVDGGGVDCTEGEIIVPIEKIIPHPQYNLKKQHDIGLIRLAQTVQYTDFIRPICLPTSDFTISTPWGLELQVAGWGMIDNQNTFSDVKMKVSLPYMSYKNCQPSYIVPENPRLLWKGQFCAGGKKGKDSCKGDSGGPIMSLNGRRFDAEGIVSFGPIPCGKHNVPGVYTKVYQYLEWITDQIVD